MQIINNPPIEREGYKRYIRTIKDDASLNKQDIIKRKFEFLREVVDQGLFMGVLNCGPVGFDKLSMYHDGECWVIRLEAEEYILDNQG